MQDMRLRQSESHLHLSCHEVQELGEVDGAVAISINLVDHVLQLCLSWVLPEGSHDSAELLRCDCACDHSHCTLTARSRARRGKGWKLLAITSVVACAVLSSNTRWMPLVSQMEVDREGHARTISILVKERKSLLELCNLLVSQLSCLCHGALGVCSLGRAQQTGSQGHSNLQVLACNADFLGRRGSF